jgi:hypothetical protein
LVRGKFDEIFPLIDFMKVFKTIDCVVQVFLIAVAFILFMILGIKFTDESTFGIYFLVGGWQIASLFIHLIAGKRYRSKLRRLYHILVLVTLGIGLVMVLGGYKGSGRILVLAGFLFWSPLLAILYVTACIQETKKLTAPVKETGLIASQEVSKRSEL